MFLLKHILCTRMYKITTTAVTCRTNSHIVNNLFSTKHKFPTRTYLSNGCKPCNNHHLLVNRRFAATKSTNGTAQSSITTNVPKVRPKLSDFRRLFELARSEKTVLIASVGCLVVSSTITMGVPYCIGKIMDIIFTGTLDSGRLTEFCMTLMAVFIVGAVANFGRVYLMNGASKTT